MPQEQELKQKELHQRIEDLLEQEDRDNLAALLEDEHTSDIAEVMEVLSRDEMRQIFDLLQLERSSEVFNRVNEATRSKLFKILSSEEMASIIAEIDADDAADILAEMEPEDSDQVMGHMTFADARQIKRLLRYSEDSAGGIMDPILISVYEDATVREAVDKIRSTEFDEDFYSVFVTNRLGQFLGDVRLRSLLTSKENTLIKDLLETDTVYVRANMDQEEVRNIFKKHDLIVVPVLDENDRLIGRITADRIIEVADEEAAEDLYTMAGTEVDELEKFSAFHAARIRMTWLLPCLLGTAVTALVMMFFKNHNPTIYLLSVAFVPMIAAISGNAGLQTSTIVVSGLASGHLAALKISQVFSREFRIALVVGLSCGVLASVIRVFLPPLLPDATATETEITSFLGYVNVAVAFGIAMFTAIMVATSLGFSLPFLFRKVGIDPAIASGPLVTTANDSISVLIYMVLSLTFLK